MASPYGFSQTGIDLLYAELAKRGINPAAAAGAISGVMGESGANLNPTSFNTKDPGGGSGGIGQWNRGRLVGPSGMLAFARNAGVPGIDIDTPTDAKKVPLAVQTQYLGHELDTTYSGVTSQLRNATSPQQALNVWVNSYEDPADKAGAIAQRSQYLAPVSAHLSGAPLPAGGAAPAPAAAPGPIDPSIIARGGVSPPIPTDGTTPGTTLTSLPAASSSGILPGFGTKQASDDFLAGLKKAGITPDTGQGGEGDQGPPKPSPIMRGPGLINASDAQTIGRAAMQMQANGLAPSFGATQPYGSSINSQPLAWSSAPIGAPAWLTQGGQQSASQGMGTSLNSLQMAYGLSPQQLQMMMNPMMLDQGGGYG